MKNEIAEKRETLISFSYKNKIPCDHEQQGIFYFIFSHYYSITYLAYRS